MGLLGPSMVAAEGRTTLGTGGLHTNDTFSYAPLNDRWRTGSGVVSMVRARGWDGAVPGRVGDLIEYRFRAEVISPANIVRPARFDRPYAAALSFGIHTHFQRNNIEYSLGADLVVTGPQTGLETFQAAIHDIIGISGASAAALRGQIPNGIHPTAIFEAGRTYEISPRIAFRPFLELQGGIETLTRIGGDLHIGRVGRDALLVRDVSTGQRYMINHGQFTGWAATLGADIAYVNSSVLLPATARVTLKDTRVRARAGIRWQGENRAYFYGLTWLGKEFSQQPEGQVVGSMHIEFGF